GNDEFVVGTSQIRGVDGLKNYIVGEIDTARFGLYKNSVHPKNLMNTKKAILNYFNSEKDDNLMRYSLSPPESITALNEILELREQLASLQALLNKSEYEFDVIISLKRTNGFKWIVNIEEATLKGLKNSIYEMNLRLPTLENDGAVLNFMYKVKRYSSQNDQDFSKMLWQFTFSKMRQLYGFRESDDPLLSVFPLFTCGCKDLKDKPSQYVCSYLVAGVNLYKGKFELQPEKNITRPHEHRPVDFAIGLLRTAKTAGVTEVKDEDFFKGIAQNAVQLESALSNCKRKVSEMEEDNTFVDKVFRIVTDAEKWYFLECSLNNQDKLRFKLSEPVVIVYKDENMENMVRKVLGHIAWLLEEVQKSDLALDTVKGNHKLLLDEDMGMKDMTEMLEKCRLLLLYAYFNNLRGLN
ncbi:14055_t:CDS:2, partial [Funneliformis caledonium]